MSQSRGYATIVDPFGVKEVDYLKCNHCQRLVQIRPYQPLDEIGGHCRACHGFLCPNCETLRAKGEACKPWEKKFDEIEARDRARASYGI